ncbi:MAG: 3-deoxy-7-phosphoheptulonate synthase, partial [Alphaproteobacteria bacterium]
MIVTMQSDAAPTQIEAVAELIRKAGHDPLVLPGENRTAIGIPAALSNDERLDLETRISAMEGVNIVVQTSRPYQLASREAQRENTIVRVKGVEIGGAEP